MTTFSSSLQFTESFDASCQLRLHSSTCHVSTSEKRKWGDMQRDRERDREVCSKPSSVDNILYPDTRQNTDTDSLSTETLSLLVSAKLFNQKFHFYLARVWAKWWNWSEIDQNARMALPSKGDFIDLPKSFSIIASVKCRNSSFRWVGTRVKNTTWTICRSLK